MSKHINRILVATDGTPSAQRAVELGVELAEADGAQVTFVHVAPPVAYRASRSASMRPAPRRLAHVGDSVLDEAVAVASDHHVRSERELIAGEPGEVIVVLAEAMDADLIVVGERPRRLRLGAGVARWVSGHTRRPVLVARPRIAQLAA